MALQLGDSGPEVGSLQTQLADLGFPLGADGIFGPRTDDAVRGFQSVVGLVVDGIVGPLTNAALASSQWQDIATSATALTLQRRVTTDTVTTALVATTLEADVRWPGIAFDHPYDVSGIQGTLDAMAQAWIDDAATLGDTAGPAQPHTIDGELEATLIAPTLLGTAGVLSRFTSGAAHPNPVIVTANLDVAADALLAPSELFMPGSGWLGVLRGIVLLTFPPTSGNDAVADNYQHLSLTPSGVEIRFQPEQLDLPLAAGVQTVHAQWAKLEGVMRPSIVARAFGHSAGGPGPHLT